MELRTNRLLLRQFRQDDIEAFSAMCADPEVMRFLSADGAVLSRADAWRQMAMLLGHWQLRGYGMWALEELSTGSFVGRLGLHFPEGWPDREIGWALARGFWGQGLATEAAQAVVEHAFCDLGWSHLISLIMTDNKRSMGVAERLGAKVAGTYPLHGLPHHVYRLEAGEWLARRPVDASEEQAYEELQSYTLGRASVDFIHQHIVDAWAAQHADDRTKPITLTFALIGLYLHLEKGLSGRQVQRMHMRLAQRRRSWPSFPLPRGRGAITAVQVLAAAPGLERDQAIDAWCLSVWEAYNESHQAVAELLRQYGIE